MKIEIGGRYLIEGYIEIEVMRFSKSGNFVLGKLTWRNTDARWFDMSLFQKDACEHLHKEPSKVSIKVLLRVSGSIPFTIQERVIEEVSPSGRYVKLDGSSSWVNQKDILETIE